MVYSQRRGGHVETLLSDLIGIEDVQLGMAETPEGWVLVI